MMDKESPRRRVFPWPQYRTNPYLPRLMRELGARGFEDVNEWRFGGGAARLEPGDWVHFHWPGAKLQTPLRFHYRWNVYRFRRQLDRLRARGIRLCWTAHNLLPHDDPFPQLAREARLALLEAVEHVFVHFPGALTRLADELGWRGPSTVIPHGHYADDYPAPPERGPARAALGLAEDAFVVLLLGALRPYKGIAEAVAAFQAIARASDRMIVAGRPEGRVGAELAAARSDPRVLVNARLVPGAEMVQMLAAADAFVLAHRVFFTSGSAVLATSFGLPIVGPAEEHLASFGGEPRLWDAPPTREGLAGALERLRGATVDREALRQAALRDFSWSVAADRVAAVLGGPARSSELDARVTPK
jgi:beta-1,4-mannosyltransferase